MASCRHRYAKWTLASPATGAGYEAMLLSHLECETIPSSMELIDVLSTGIVRWQFLCLEAPTVDSDSSLMHHVSCSSPSRRFTASRTNSHWNFRRWIPPYHAHDIRFVAHFVTSVLSQYEQVICTERVVQRPGIQCTVKEEEARGLSV